MPLPDAESGQHATSREFREAGQGHRRSEQPATLERTSDGLGEDGHGNAEGDKGTRHEKAVGTPLPGQLTDGLLSTRIPGSQGRRRQPAADKACRSEDPSPRGDGLPSVTWAYGEPRGQVPGSSDPSSVEFPFVEEWRAEATTTGRRRMWRGS